MALQRICSASSSDATWSIFWTSSEVEACLHSKTGLRVDGEDKDGDEDKDGGEDKDEDEDEGEDEDKDEIIGEGGCTGGPTVSGMSASSSSDIDAASSPGRMFRGSPPFAIAFLIATSHACLSGTLAARISKFIPAAAKSEGLVLGQWRQYSSVYTDESIISAPFKFIDPLRVKPS